MGHSDDNLSDDEIIAREQRKVRQMRLAGPIFAGLIGGTTLMFYRYLPGLLRFTPLLLIPVFATVMFYTWPSKRSRAPEVIRRRLDEYGRYKRSGLWSSILVATILCFISMRETAFLRTGVLPPLIFLFFFLFFAVTLACGTDWMKLKTVPRDDELARAIRTQAARAGYGALMVVLCAVWLAGLFAPGWVMILVRLGLFLGVAVPACIYLFLDWRANPGG